MMKKTKFYSILDYLIILTIIISPVIVNIIVKADFGFAIAGDQSGWLSFYGALVGSLITMFVLYKTLKRNHVENENNRILQLSILKYQQRRSWLNDIAKMLILVRESYSIMILLDIRDDISKGCYNEAIQKIKHQ